MSTKFVKFSRHRVTNNLLFNNILQIVRRTQHFRNKTHKIVGMPLFLTLQFDKFLSDIELEYMSAVSRQFANSVDIANYLDNSTIFLFQDVV